MAPDGFFTVPNWLLRDSDLTGRELLVLIALMGRANADGKCWPSLALIAKEARCSSKNTVKAALSGLRARGLVTWEERRSEDGDPASHMYHVLVDNFLGGGSTIDLPGSTIDRGVGQSLTGGGSTIDPEVNTIKKTQLKILTPLEPVDNSNGETAFARFWNAYPRKEGKREARRAWDEAITQADVETIIQAATRYAQTTTGTPTQYVKTARTWLRDHRWEDQPATTRSETPYAQYAARHGPWRPNGLEDRPHLEIKALQTFVKHLNEGETVQQAQDAAYRAAQGE